MNSHIPFDANNDWTLDPYHCNQSNDPLVDKLIGNAYAVVRAVYCNLGNLKLLYDFLNTHGMVLGVKSEDELKKLSKLAKFARIYNYSSTGKHEVIDYLYVEDDSSGIKPDDPTATGSWIKVSTSSDKPDDGKTNNTYVLWDYTATGGETTITVPLDTVGIPFITVDGFTQTLGKGFTFKDGVIQLAQELEEGQEIICFLTGIPATPDMPSIDNWKVVNWLYNYGAAVGGEQLLNIPFVFQDIPAVYKNGLRLYRDLNDNSYTVDSSNNRIFLTEPLATDDRVIVVVGGNIETVYAPAMDAQIIARAFNIKDSEVILSTDSQTFLNGKVVVYVPVEQKSYKLPNLPTNVRIGSITGDQLTYVPGNVTVTLTPISII